MKYLLPRFVLAISLCSIRVWALDVYSIYDQGCVNQQGAIVYVDDHSVMLLNLDGSIRSLPINKIGYIAMYNVLENPFPSISFRPEDALLFEVTSLTVAGSFFAYAVHFSDDLVLFLDLRGHVHVIELKDIIALRRQTKVAKVENVSLERRTVKMLPPPGKESCASSNDAKGFDYHLGSARIYSDSFQVDAFLHRMRRGYHELKSLEERTSFYAKPILFDQKNRLGIYHYDDTYAETWGLRIHQWQLPAYFSMGGGSPYRFQSSFSIGMQSWSALPKIEPIPAIKTEFKSHLVHGQLIANLGGLAAGKQVLAQRFSDTEGEHRKELWLYNSFNHLTLLGIDYSSWSVSFGSFFPTMAVGAEKEFREAYAPRASFLGRLAYQEPKWLLELFYFNTDYSDEASDDETDSADANHYVSDLNGTLAWYSQNFAPKKFSVYSQTVRFNTQYFFSDDILVQGDVLLASHSYRETALRRDEPVTDYVFGENYTSGMRTGTMVGNKVGQKEVSFRLQTRIDLGKWVALSASTYFSLFETEGSLDTGGSSDESHSDEIFSYFGAFELLL